MDVTIHYCRLCGLRPRAEEIAAALMRDFALECEIREGPWGTFRIEHRGEEVFNRWKSRGWLGRIGLGRTPTADEIVELFRDRCRQPEHAPRTVSPESRRFRSPSAHPSRQS